MIKFIQKALKEKDQVSHTHGLIDVLIKNLGRKYPERSHKTVHASDVTKEDFCPRQYLLMDAHNMTRPDTYINAALKATFDVGEATAAQVVKWLSDSAWGRWSNPVTGEVLPFARTPPGANWNYSEVKFFGESSHISGSIDVLADLGHPKLRAVELKIMKVDDFEKLAAPLVEHRLRTMLYLQLIADSENPFRFKVDTDEAHILYVSRGFGKKHDEYGQILPFKEFIVKRDDAAVETFIERGKTVKFCRENKVIPQPKVCENSACPTAKKCPVRQICWSS